MSNNAMHKYNTVAIDIVKLIMAIVVVAVHTVPLTGIGGDWSGVFRTLSQIPVPFFFLSTGYLLGIKLLNSDNKTGVILGYLKKIVKLYLIWTLVYFPLAVIGFSNNGLSFGKSCVEYLRGVLLIGENYNSWPLWYLLSVIYAVLALLLMYRYRISDRGLLFFACMALVASISIDWIVATTAELPGLLALPRKAITATIVSGRLLRGMFYIPAGILLAKGKLPALYNMIIAALGLIVCCLLDGILFNFAVAITSVCLFCAVISIDINKSSAFVSMRKISTDIYFLHMLIWTAYYAVFYGEKRFGIDGFIVTTISCIVISLTLQWIRRKRRSKAIST